MNPGLDPGADGRDHRCESQGEAVQPGRSQANNQTKKRGRTMHQSDARPDGGRDRDQEHPTTPADARRRQVGSRLLRNLLERLGNPPIELELAGGAVASSPGGPPVACIRIADRTTLFRLALNGAIEFGDAYADGRLEVDGDLAAVLDEVYRHAPPPQEAPAGGTRWLARPQRGRSNTLRGSKDNIHRHYDLGNEFYSLWLGQTMAYTCAYYPHPGASLDEAQVAKMDHVCRKLRLEPGETVIEAGCGWGTLALHMARRYGVRVRAFNISAEQVAWARAQADATGLAASVEFVEDDYRNIDGTCDKFVSVGMLEHVGLGNYRGLGAVVARCLREDGLGLIHSIGRNRPAPMHPWIEKRIFPGAYPPSLWEMRDIFEPFDFSVLDVENLRLHYARTLDHWWAAFESARDRVARMFDERFVRLWRLYLAGSAAAFRAGQLQLFQVVFAPGRNNAVPWTRARLYSG